MKKIILLMLLINISKVYANENYKFRIMGNFINNDITELPDKSIFNIFEGKGLALKRGFNFLNSSSSLDGIYFFSGILGSGFFLII